MINAAKRSGNLPLSIFLAGSVPQGTLPGEVHKIFTRCKRLYIHYRAYPHHFYQSPPNIPALEELELLINDTVKVNDLFSSLTIGSPLLSSVEFSKYIYNPLVIIPPFLQRIRRLALGRNVPSQSQPPLFKDLIQLESLT